MLIGDSMWADAIGFSRCFEHFPEVVLFRSGATPVYKLQLGLLKLVRVETMYRVYIVPWIICAL